MHEVCDIGNGYAFKSTEFQSVGTPLLRISNINNNRVSFGEGTAYVAPERLETHSDYVVNNGDVVIALSGATTGKYGVYLHDTPCLLNQRIGIIRKTPSDTLYLRYFYFYLNVLRSEILRKAEGAAQPNISTKEIGQFKIPLPPLAEQKKIAAILDAADQLRQKDQQLIDHYTSLSQSLFLEMFGDPVSNPMGWQKMSIGAALEEGFISDLQDGNHGEKHPKVSDFCDKGLPFVMANCMGDGELNLSKAYKLSECWKSKLRIGFARPDDVLLSHKGTVGEVAIVSCESEIVILSPQVTYYRTTKLLDSQFLAGQFSSVNFQQLLHKEAKQSTRAYIGITRQKKLPLIIPRLELQEKYTSRFRQIELQKRQTKKNLENSEALFNSLLQRAFKGELTSSKAA